MHRRTRQHEEESMGLHQRPKVLDRSLQILPFFLAYCYASYNSFSIDSIDAARARIDVKFWFCVRNISNSNTSNFEVLDYARFQPASSESRYVSPGIHTALTPRRACVIRVRACGEYGRNMIELDYDKQRTIQRPVNEQRSTRPRPRPRPHRYRDR